MARPGLPIIRIQNLFRQAVALRGSALAHAAELLLDKGALGPQEMRPATGSSKHDHRGLLDVIDGIMVRIRHQQIDRSETSVDGKHFFHSLQRSQMRSLVVDQIGHLGLLLRDWWNDFVS